MENLPEIPTSIYEELKFLSVFLTGWQKEGTELTLNYYVPEGCIDYSTFSFENFRANFKQANITNNFIQPVYNSRGRMVRGYEILGRFITLVMDTPSQEQKQIK